MEKLDYILQTFESIIGREETDGVETIKNKMVLFVFNSFYGVFHNIGGSSCKRCEA